MGQGCSISCLRRAVESSEALARLRRGCPLSLVSQSPFSNARHLRVHQKVSWRARKKKVRVVLSWGSELCRHDRRVFHGPFQASSQQRQHPTHMLTKVPIMNAESMGSREEIHFQTNCRNPSRQGEGERNVTRINNGGVDVTIPYKNFISQRFQWCVWVMDSRPGGFSGRLCRWRGKTGGWVVMMHIWYSKTPRPLRDQMLPLLQKRKTPLPCQRR